VFRATGGTNKGPEKIALVKDGQSQNVYLGEACGTHWREEK